MSFINITSGTGTSATPTAAAANHSAGSLLVGWVKWEDTAATITDIQDTAGNTYDFASMPQSPAHGVRGQMFFAKNALGNANNVVTITMSTSVPFWGIIVAQYSNMDTSSPLDDFSSGGAAGGTNLESGNIDTTVANTVLVAACGLYSSKSATPGANWTERFDPNPGAFQFYDREVSSTGTYAVTGTGADSVIWTGSEGWSTTLAAFKVSSGPPPDLNTLIGEPPCGSSVLN